MKKALWVALHEFAATVCTKAFVVGLLFMPVMVVVVIFAFSFFDDDDFRPSGRIAVVDPTGRVTAEARQVLARGGEAGRVVEQAREAGIELGGAAELVESLDLGPDFTLTQLPDDADLDAEKRFLFDERRPESRLALVVIHADAIESESAELGSYDLYVAPGTDQRETQAVRGMLRDAIVNLRLEAAGYERSRIDRLTNVSSGRSITVTESEERATFEGLNVILPMAFTILLFMGVIGGGQGLMASTIEEKSSRVVEVLLSAISPMQLMTGKLVGYMGASLLGMSIYLIAGLVTLSSFSLLGLIEPVLILYLFLFFCTAYFMVGSFMLAIGAAVNELRETQSLMMPVTIVLMLPWFLWMPISRNPDSTLAVVASFIPPINSFGMLFRLASSSPPPAWQVWASIAVGVIGVYVVLWCAARVFRIGLLLTGKPPGFATLMRWIRDAG